MSILVRGEKGTEEVKGKGKGKEGEVCLPSKQDS